MAASKTASVFQLGVRFSDGTLLRQGSGVATLTLPSTSNVLAGQLSGDGTIFSSSLVVSSSVGTITLPTPKNQSANLVFAGPTSGGAAAPTFRALVTADLPAGVGTVTSVSLTAPAEISVSGSPITTTGTIALTWANETANRVFAGPSTGSPGTPAFRALVAADIPNLDASKITTGQIALARGGTNADLSGTGGTSQVLKQTSVGGSITVGQLAFSDISGQAALASQVSGTLPPANGGAADGTGAYFWAPYGNISPIVLAVNSTVMGVNQVRACMIVIPYKITFTRMTVNVATTSNGNHFYTAIYDSSKNLIIQATFTLGAGTGVLTTTVASTTLNPGIYWLAWSADNATAQMTGFGNIQGGNLNMLNANAVRYAVSPNSTSAGVMPSSLGTVTNAGQNQGPFVLLD